MTVEYISDKVSDFSGWFTRVGHKQIQFWKVRIFLHQFISTSEQYYCGKALTAESFLHYHPILCIPSLSQGCDNVLCVWNVGTGELVYKLSDAHPDLIYSVSWNTDGSAICTVCKDKALRIIDPRRRSVLKVTWLLLWSTLLRQSAWLSVFSVLSKVREKVHDGTRPMKAVFLSNGKILTTGFNRRTDRQVALWDTVRNKNPLDPIGWFDTIKLAAENYGNNIPSTNTVNQ